MNYEELERAAYLAGNIELSEAYARIMDLEREVEALEETMSDTETLEQWEKNHDSAQAYYDFFHGCFDRLNGHYPARSVTSDYDCSVIYQAIERGETVKGDTE